MLKEKDLKAKIESDEDFINSPNYRNSLKFFVSKNPDGVSNERIAKVLMISEEEVEATYLSALKKIKDKLTAGM